MLWPLYTPCIEFAPVRLSKPAMDAWELIELIFIDLLNEKITQKSNTYSSAYEISAFTLKILKSN